MNQPLEAHLEALRPYLHFLSEQERETEITELRRHFEERIASYVGAGDSPQWPLACAWHKFGDPKHYVRERRRQFYLRSLRNVAMNRGIWSSVKIFKRLCKKEKYAKTDTA